MPLAARMPPSLFTMPERWITALHIENPGLESSTETRDRLRGLFPRNATRRMTQLGITLGATLQPLNLTQDDTLVYASVYAETRALEDYLDSFPNPSPTLFQTSIHPGSVQQNLIQQQQPINELLPITGSADLPAQALMAALLAPAERVILCGGEERGSWLLEQHHASDRTFAFSLALSKSPDGAIGRIGLELAAPEDCTQRLSFPGFFELLQSRHSGDLLISPGRRFSLDWL